MDKQVLEEIINGLREDFGRAKEETQSKHVVLDGIEIEDEDGYDLTVTYRVCFPLRVDSPTKEREINNIEYNLQRDSFNSIYVEEG